MDAVCPHCKAALTFGDKIPQFCSRCGQTLPRDLPTTPTPVKPGSDRTNPFLMSVVVGLAYFFLALIVLNEGLSAYMVGRIFGYYFITTIVMGFVIREMRCGWARAFCLYPLVFFALIFATLR